MSNAYPMEPIIFILYAAHPPSSVYVIDVNLFYRIVQCLTAQRERQPRHHSNPSKGPNYILALLKRWRYSFRCKEVTLPHQHFSLGKGNKSMDRGRKIAHAGALALIWVIWRALLMAIRMLLLFSKLWSIPPSNLRLTYLTEQMGGRGCSLSVTEEDGKADLKVRAGRVTGMTNRPHKDKEQWNGGQLWIWVVATIPPFTRADWVTAFGTYWGYCYSYHSAHFKWNYVANVDDTTNERNASFIIAAPSITGWCGINLMKPGERLINIAVEIPPVNTGVTTVFLLQRQY